MNEFTRRKKTMGIGRHMLSRPRVILISTLLLLTALACSFVDRWLLRKIPRVKKSVQEPHSHLPLTATAPQCSHGNRVGDMRPRRIAFPERHC